MERRKVNRISVGLLVVGLGSAAVIFALASANGSDPLRDDPLGQKKLNHELQVIGGKANLLASDFQDWFDGLWHGPELAGTVAVLTIAGTLAFRFFATLPPVPKK